MKRRSGEKKILYILGGIFLSLLEIIFTALRSKGKSLSNIKEKLNTIKQLNTNFISVLEKPGLENMIDA
ncbi:MAG: hypothetical protein H7Y00_08645 [Fimbriimonadaceae bacterium]|nr:hypothetical protein [Chitinophagales bacterium]